MFFLQLKQDKMDIGVYNGRNTTHPHKNPLKCIYRTHLYFKKKNYLCITNKDSISTHEYSSTNCRFSTHTDQCGSDDHSLQMVETTCRARLHCCWMSRQFSDFSYAKRVWRLRYRDLGGYRCYLFALQFRVRFQF